ncbi:MAG: EamA family transporter [Clostridia bacterium]|nr:EamA family transporter [Clostridia bacterium]
MDKKLAAKVIIAALICHIFWGFSFMASGYALSKAHVFLLLSHRFLLAFIVMSLLALFGFAKQKLRDEVYEWLKETAAVHSDYEYVRYEKEEKE